MGAHIVGRKRIHFRNACQCRHKRRSDRPPGSHQVTAVVGMLDKLMGDIIQDAIAVIDDRCQLQIKPVLDNFGQRFSIKLHCFLIAHGFQLIISTGNFRIV